MLRYYCELRFLQVFTLYRGNKSQLFPLNLHLLELSIIFFRQRNHNEQIDVLNENFEEMKELLLWMNWKQWTIALFQRIWELGLNCSIAPSQLYNVNWFSRWYVDKPLYVWWPPWQVKLCQSCELTRNYFTVCHNSELWCCSFKYTPLNGQ